MEAGGTVWFVRAAPEFDSATLLDKPAVAPVYLVSVLIPLLHLSPHGGKQAKCTLILSSPIPPGTIPLLIADDRLGALVRCARHGICKKQLSRQQDTGTTFLNEGKCMSLNRSN